MSGTQGRALRLEAIKIRLTGELANKYDIYYRVHNNLVLIINNVNVEFIEGPIYIKSII